MGKCWSRVSIRDGKGITHSVDVLAESVYEAVALAVHQITDGPMPMARPNAMAQVRVEVLPETKGAVHELDLGKVFNFARSKSVLSPAEMVRRNRIRQLMGLEEG